MSTLTLLRADFLFFKSNQSNILSNHLSILNQGHSKYVWSFLESGAHTFATLSTHQANGTNNYIMGSRKKGPIKKDMVVLAVTTAWRRLPGTRDQNCHQMHLSFSI